MRTPLYDRGAGVNGDADRPAHAVALGTDMSRVAERALIAAAEKENIREELRADARWTAGFVATHGYPFPVSMAMFMPEEGGPDYLNDDAA
nr:hypothetical protein [uncultured Rhodopila sp.]